MAFKTQCPHCSKVLKLKSEAAIGRKAPCPKCGEAFKVAKYEEPAVDEWEEAGDDEYSYDYSDEDYGDYGDDYGEADDAYAEYEPAPSRSARRSKGGKSKKKAAGAPAWLAPAGIGLVVLLGLGLLGSGIYFVAGMLGGGSSNVINLAWLPGNADMYLHAEPDKMWAAPILAPLRENEMLQKAMAQAGQNGQLDLKPEDIESVTMAGVDMADQMSARVPLFGGKAQFTGEVAKRADPKHISVIRLKRDLSTDELAGMPGAERKSHGSSEYFVSGVGSQRAGFHLASPRLLLTGTESELMNAIDRGETQERVDRIDFIDPNHQFVMVFAPQNVLQSVNAASGGATPGDRLGNSINRGTKAMALGLSLNQNVDLQVQFDCFDSDAASTIQSDFDAAITDIKAKLSEQSANTPEAFQGLVDVATQSLNSLQASTSGNLVAFSGSVPGSVGDEIKKLAESPMAAFMLPGLLNGGGNSFGGQGLGSSPSVNQPPAASLNSNESQQFSPGGPDAAVDKELKAVQDERKQVLDELGNLKGRIKSGTGQILDSVPGSR
ncbi:MAG: zinc ribbon domain-containing protein [Planctomycetota bacterium]|jgi:hypothetical protein